MNKSESNGNPQRPEEALTLHTNAHRLYELIPEAVGTSIEERDMTLRDFWRIIRNHAVMIVAGTLGITALVLVWMALGSDYYEGSARIEIGLESQSPPPGDSASRDLEVRIDPAYLGTQLQIIRSPMLLQEVVDALDLQHDRVYTRYLTRRGRRFRELLRLSWIAKHDEQLDQEPDQPVLTAALHSSSSEAQVLEAKQLEPYITDLQKRLTIEPVREPSAPLKDTRIITITVRHPSRVHAAKLANALADAYVYNNEAQKARAGKTTNDYLQRRIADLQTEIRGNEE